MFSRSERNGTAGRHSVRFGRARSNSPAGDNCQQPQADSLGGMEVMEVQTISFALTI